VPLLGKLIYWMFGSFYGLMLAMFGAKWAIRLTAAATLAGLYIACAITFSIMIVPWLAAFAATTLGYFLGLLFPPIAGTIIAALTGWWACILAKRHSIKLIKMTVGGSA